MDIREVKANLNKYVHYESRNKAVGGNYLFTGCIIRRYGDEFGYTAELKQGQNSLLYVRLEEIEAVNQR